ncbi:MAG: S41 family peptidase [Patescibacteria group bacterium]|nr:S41 family peptidase [Patescibacteria group bacterium]
MQKKYLILSGALISLIIFSFGVFAGYSYFKQSSQKQEESVELKFLLEVYDKIQENYWEKTTEEELSELFKLGIEKITGEPQDFIAKNKEGLKIILEKVIKKLKDEQKEDFSATLANLVLQNLKPPGRSALYTQTEEKSLSQRVQNINPQTGEIEPTVFSKLLRPDIFYLQIKKISPQTLEEFQKAALEADVKGGKELNSLILDLRGNIGGSVDILPYFLGHFIGLDQYAYEFYQQGEKTPFKTKIGWLPSLVRYKKVIVLVNRDTQSSAELFASVLKKYNVGILLGTSTRGWGTIEKVFELENQINPAKIYSIFLVHSIALRDDGQPIEGRGVDPLINIADPDWPDQVFAYFHYQELIESLKEILQ